MLGHGSGAGFGFGVCVGVGCILGYRVLRALSTSGVLKATGMLDNGLTIALLY